MIPEKGAHEMKAEHAKEIVVEVVNNAGVLADLAKVIAEKGVSLLAVHGSVQGSRGIVRMITDDNLRAVDALKKARYVPREAEVVAMGLDHKPGILRGVMARLAAEDIDIHHIYATATRSQNTCMVVFASSDNDRALVTLNRSS
jgi:hypothetical protein